MSLADIPAELRGRDQWLLWSANSDPPKVPLNENGNPASWNDPNAWLSFEEACEISDTRADIHGVGFVVSDADPMIGLDLDGVLREKREEKPKEWVPEIAPLLETWMQYSSSGTGMHAFARDTNVPDWWSDVHYEDAHEGVEAYSEKFFVMTGDVVGAAADTVQTIEVSPFLADAYEAIKGEPPQLPGGDRGNGDTDVDLDVHDILGRSRYPEGENKPHPFHDSSTGTNFRVHEGGGTWRCWRHGITGNAAHLVGIEQGVIDCGEWEHGGLDSDTWRDVFDAARDAGYDIPEPESNGAADSIPDEHREPDTIGFDPLTVIERAGGDPDEDELADLANDKIAYALAELIDFSDNVHFRWTHDNDELWAYKDGMWEAGADAQLRKTLHYGLRYRNSKRMFSETQHALKSRPTLGIEREQLGAPDGTIAVENGLLDLRGGDVTELEPEHYAVSRLPVEYDPDAEWQGTRWESFLEESVREGDMEKLQEYAGYLLWHHAQPHGKAMLLIGPTDAGKGVFLRVIEDILGEGNVASQSLFDLMQTRWGMAELFGKMANIRNEVTADGLKNVNKFKEITGGGDRVSAERKGQDKFKFQVTQKFLFSTNQVPTVEHAGEAFFNRLLFVKFPTTVPEDDQDPKLDDKLLEHRPAVLNWMVEGLNRLLDQGRFSGELDVDGKRNTADAWGSLMDRFKHNVIEVTGNSDDMVAKDDLFEIYDHFGDWVNKPADIAQQQFTKKLKAEGGIADGRSRAVGDDDDRRNVYVGLRVTPDAEHALNLKEYAHEYDDIDTDTPQGGGEDQTRL